MRTEEEKLIEKLQKVEALFARTTFAGERDAAANAIEQIRERLRKCSKSDPPIEYKFTLNDPWSHRLLLALLRRYGIRPYRYRGQRHTTIMAMVPVSFVDQTLWPEFLELAKVLDNYLAEVTNRVIAESIFGDTSEAEVRTASSDRGLPPPK